MGLYAKTGPKIRGHGAAIAKKAIDAIAIFFYFARLLLRNDSSPPPTKKILI